jgi:predicted metalloprotease
MSRPVVIGSGGCGGLLLFLVIGLLLGFDPLQLMMMAPSSGVVETGRQPGPPPPGQDQMADFVSVVLADTEDTWNAIFAEYGESYPEPVLTLFDGAVRSACGIQSAAVGPFYCPGDQHVYLDLTFFRDLQARFGAPGDFAQAYVIAHEVGHHVQNVLGISGQVSQRQQMSGPAEANALSVRLELQADCLAGVWGHHAQRMRNILEPGDLEEALRAAAAIGDDRLQRQAQGYAVPDSFTHGSSEQRVRWFRTGFETGDIDACDTFTVPSP